jgi:hypothetical protein
MKKFGLAIFFLSMAICLTAQINLLDYDTIPIRKTQERKLIYEFDHPLFGTITIKRENAIAEGNYATIAESISGPRSLIGILGRGPVPNYLMPAVLISDPMGYGWSIDMYSKGTTGNDLVKTAEGKASEIPEYLDFYWKSGWLGLIRQGTDTLAYYGISEQPEKDALFRNEYLTTRGLLPPIDPKKKRLDTEMGLIYKNYGLFGEFKGAKMMVIFYERNRTAFMFLNDKLDAIFQLDFDIPGALIVRLSKKDFPRYPPVLMVRRGVTEDQQTDLCRLAVFCMLTAQAMR